MTIPSTPDPMVPAPEPDETQQILDQLETTGIEDTDIEVATGGDAEQPETD